MAHTLRISDGTTTCDLIAGTDYKNITAGGWAPKRAQRIPGVTTGRTKYYDVDENPIALSIPGTDKGNCLTKLAKLSNLLDQAEAWANHEPVAVVYIEYEPHDTDGVVVRAPIVGPPSFGDFLQVPNHFDSDIIGGGLVLGTNSDPITLQFRRKGQWLGTTEVELANATLPAIITCTTFSESFTVPVPYDIRLGFDLDVAAYATENNGYLLMTNAAAKLNLSEAEDWSDSTTNWTDNYAITAASGGQVKRLTPSSIINHTIYTTTSGFNADARMVQMFAVLRNSSATVTYDTYWTWSGLNSTLLDQKQKTKVIDASDQDPRVFYWDPIPLKDELDNYSVGLSITPSAASGAGHELDIDYIVIVAVDESTRIVHLPRLGTHNTWSADGYFSVSLNHRLLTHTTPAIFESEGVFGGDYDSLPPYDGYTTPYMTGNVIAGTMLALDGAGEWIMQDASGNDIDLQITVSRYKGYLTPL